MAKKKKKAKVKKVKKEKKQRFTGKLSGLGMFQTWIQVFEANHTKKLTDSAILDIMKKNFPTAAKKSVVFSKVGAHRTMYNRGRFSHGVKPKKASVKYGD